MNRLLLLMALPFSLIVLLSAHRVLPHTAAPAFSPETAAQVRVLVPPGVGEDQFASIPWQVSLGEARTLAAKEGKPILLWEMDGHPLGCG